MWRHPNILHFDKYYEIGLLMPSSYQPIWPFHATTFQGLVVSWRIERSSYPVHTSHSTRDGFPLLTNSAAISSRAVFKSLKPRVFFWLNILSVFFFRDYFCYVMFIQITHYTFISNI